MEQIDNGVGETQQEPFNRPPRIWPQLPDGEVTFPVPPEQEREAEQPGPLTLLLPMLSIVILLGVTITVSHGSLQQLAFLLPMAIFMLINPLTSTVNARLKRRALQRKQATQNKQYMEDIAKTRAQLAQLATEQRRIGLLIDPDPIDLEERVRGRSQLWERRPEDPDFLMVRVGKGRQPLTVKMELPSHQNTSSHLTQDLQQLKDDFAFVMDVPCSISLTQVKSFGITGRRQDVAAFVHGMLCQIAVHHAPQEVRILGIYPASQKHDWEWLHQLPHTMPLKMGKQRRLVAEGQEEANQVLNILLEELSRRASKLEEEGAGERKRSQSKSIAPDVVLPHLVVVVHDYVEVRQHPTLANAFKLGEELGVTVIYLVAQEEAIPSACRAIIRLSTEEPLDTDTQQRKVELTYAAAGFAGAILKDVRADLVDLTTAQRISSALSMLKVVEEGKDTVNLPMNVRLLDLLEVPYADQHDVENWWNSEPRFGFLRVPIGQGINGTTWIDLNESAHGPHGIIAGTTGAGKSELLQSLIVGLAITHHPHLVNFVLVDFKGGAAFKAFEKIPHTVGMVTDLSGRLTERALVALKSELRRREHILSRANAKNITQYLAMRQDPQNAAIAEPLPHLFIVIDEFAELAKEHPTFIEGIVSVVQKGRSLGVHLILATQKPTGSVNSNIWSNLKFRICLRVASLQDSRDMLGRSEAGLLPSTIPGRAYFQIGAEIFELFQSARTSLPARISDIPSSDSAEMNEEMTDIQVLMDLLEPYQATLGAELFRPWPDPLPHRIYLPDVYQRSKPFVQANIYTSMSPSYGWLRFPVGLIDLPTEQRQEPYLVDLPREGHMLIAGGSGTGKSVLLRTIITSLILTHSPAQLHLYLIDFGGQALRVFEKLPHVGGTFGEGDEEYIHRLMRKLQGIIEERKQIFMHYQIEDFLAYQRSRRSNATPALTELPAVVLVIDRFSEFRQIHEKDMEILLILARLGRTYGVYLVVTIDRSGGLPIQFTSLMELRIIFRMVEVTDSLILLGKNDAAYLDPSLAGRGYKRGKTPLEIQFALPVVGEDEDEQNQQLDKLITAVAKEAETYHVQHAPAIQLLPEYVRLSEFLAETAQLAEADGGSPVALRLYVGIEDLSLLPIAFELSAETPHVLVAGGPGSGRTSVLHTCLFALANHQSSSHLSGESVRIILVDFRRSSRLLRSLTGVWIYADTEERLLEVVEALKRELEARTAILREELQSEEEEEAVGEKMDPIVLVIDDYDMLNILAQNPLNDLKEFLLRARDLRFHIIVAGSPNDLARSDALLQQVRSCRIGLILGGDPNDLPVLGVRISDFPPGRGHLVHRNRRYLVQVAHVEAKEMISRLTVDAYLH
jgi:DNA segregation ATPase FtsK/SpoIIIE, S-DNA-T family